MFCGLRDHGRFSTPKHYVRIWKSKRCMSCFRYVPLPFPFSWQSNSQSSVAWQDFQGPQAWLSCNVSKESVEVTNFIQWKLANKKGNGVQFWWPLDSAASKHRWSGSELVFITNPFCASCCSQPIWIKSRNISFLNGRGDFLKKTL